MVKSWDSLNDEDKEKRACILRYREHAKNMTMGRPYFETRSLYTSTRAIESFAAFVPSWMSPKLYITSEHSEMTSAQYEFEQQS